MSATSLEEFVRNVSGYLAEVEQGREVVISRANHPIARLVPALTAPKKNRTNIGWAADTLRILGPITGPVMEEDWDMLSEARPA